MTENNLEESEIASGDNEAALNGAVALANEEDEDEYVPEPQPPTYNIVLVGNQGVGKSAFNLQFIYSEYVDCYDPTKSDTYRTRIQLDGETIDLDILDTLGEEDSAETRDLFFRSGEGFVMIFALNNVDSFKAIQEYRKELMRVRELVAIPMILVGNKSDLPSERKVSCDEGQELATRWGCKYLETSVKLRDNVDEAVLDLLRLVRLQT